MTIQQLFTPEALQQHASLMKARHFTAGFDRMTGDAAVTWMQINGARLCLQLIDGSYQPMPAMGFYGKEKWRCEASIPPYRHRYHYPADPAGGAYPHLRRSILTEQLRLPSWQGRAYGAGAVLHARRTVCLCCQQGVGMAVFVVFRCCSARFELTVGKNHKGLCLV